MDAASHTVARQAELKQELRKGLEDGNKEFCWARIERNDGQVPQDIGIMKLLAVTAGSIHSCRTVNVILITRRTTGFSMRMNFMFTGLEEDTMPSAP